MIAADAVGIKVEGAEQHKTSRGSSLPSLAPTSAKLQKTVLPFVAFRHFFAGMPAIDFSLLTYECL
jgi:hypothetical protein